jgi:AcrR family transcriptional regulator
MTATATRPNQREHILDVALGLIASQGAAKMSMRQLAAACGLNVAAIYHYFESKDALVAAVVDERRYGARLAEDIPQIDMSLPPAERLAAIFRTLWNGALAEEPVWRVLLGEGLRGEPAVIPVGRNLLDVIGPGLADWLRVSIPEVASPEAVAQMMIGQMFTGFLRHIFEPELDPEGIGEQACVALVAAVFG